MKNQKKKVKIYLDRILKGGVQKTPPISNYINYHLYKF